MVISTDLDCFQPFCTRWKDDLPFQKAQQRTTNNGRKNWVLQKGRPDRQFHTAQWYSLIEHALLFKPFNKFLMNSRTNFQLSILDVFLCVWPVSVAPLRVACATFCVLIKNICVANSKFPNDLSIFGWIKIADRSVLDATSCAPHASHSEYCLFHCEIVNCDRQSRPFIAHCKAKINVLAKFADLLNVARKHTGNVIGALPFFVWLCFISVSTK